MPNAYHIHFTVTVFASGGNIPNLIVSSLPVTGRFCEAAALDFQAL
jgi:hypothetical protein